jgi:TRAP-type C4-dicarboxylate transport system permease small subunit
MFIEVVRREVFSYSSIWGEEIVRYSFIYLAWIGAAAAVKERGHIRIDVLMHYVAADGEIAALHVRRHRDVHRRLIALYWSWESVHVSWKFGSVTHGLRISQVFSSSRCPSALRSSSSG